MSGKNKLASLLTVVLVVVLAGYLLRKGAARVDRYEPALKQNSTVLHHFGDQWSADSEQIWHLACTDEQLARVLAVGYHSCDPADTAFALGLVAKRDRQLILVPPSRAWRKRERLYSKYLVQVKPNELYLVVLSF